MVCLKDPNLHLLHSLDWSSKKPWQVWCALVHWFGQWLYYGNLCRRDDPVKNCLCMLLGTLGSSLWIVYALFLWGFLLRITMFCCIYRGLVCQNVSSIWPTIFGIAQLIWICLLSGIVSTSIGTVMCDFYETFLGLTVVSLFHSSELMCVICVPMIKLWTIVSSRVGLKYLVVCIRNISCTFIVSLYCQLL